MRRSRFPLTSAPHPQMQKNRGFDAGDVGRGQLAELGSQALFRSCSKLICHRFARVAIECDKNLAGIHLGCLTSQRYHNQAVQRDISSVIADDDCGPGLLDFPADGWIEGHPPNFTPPRMHRRLVPRPTLPLLLRAVNPVPSRGTSQAVRPARSCLVRPLCPE